MTKKANKMLEVYAEKFDIHVQCFEMDAEMETEEKLDEKYDFAKCLINDIKKDFVNMISGMYRFDMLSEKDFNEVYTKSYEIYNETLEKMLDAYLEAKH